MTTGEKIALLRKKKNLTQEQVSEMLMVSRQSVSRWEMDAAFPETEKLVKLSKILECSIDFLLNEDLYTEEKQALSLSVKTCYQFIRECSCFFLATSVENKPKVRPMGFIYSDDHALYISTDKRKNVYSDFMSNPHFELISYNLNTGRWIRINGKVKIESSGRIREDMILQYPMIRQEYVGSNEIHLAIFRLQLEEVNIY